MTVDEKIDEILSEISEIKIFMAEQSIYSKDKEKRLVKVEDYVEGDKKSKWILAGIITVLATAISSFWGKIFH